LIPKNPQLIFGVHSQRAEEILMNLKRRLVVTSATVALGLLTTSGIAFAHDINRSCPSDDYGTVGENHDRTDDGCDTRDYENRGHTGDSSRDSRNYGHAHGRDGTPAQRLLDGI
jgi:hypothetical protein